MRLKLFFLLLLATNSACKKNIEFPAEIRPSDFWLRYNIADENGTEHAYQFRGEDKTESSQFPGYEITLSYFCNYEIRDSLKQISAGLSGSISGAPLTLRLNHPDLVMDPFKPSEWTQSELEALLYPGKTFAFGDGPGEAKLILQDYPDTGWQLTTTALSNQDAYLRVLETEDYGSPEIGVPYFGKKVEFEFACPLYDDSNTPHMLRSGEAVLFFRYFKY